MKKTRWAKIVRYILMLKSFKFEHLKDITCTRGIHTQGKEVEEVNEVVSQLVADGSLVKQGKSYRLTSDWEKCYDLSRKVEKIEMRR